MYKKFCKDCIQRKIGYKCDFHMLSSPPKNIGENKIDDKINQQPVDVSLVTPTQAAVEQGKSELRQEKHIKDPAARDQVQIGGNSYKRHGENIRLKIKLKKEIGRIKIQRKQKVGLKLNVILRILKRKLQQRKNRINLYGCSAKFIVNFCTPSS